MTLATGEVKTLIAIVSALVSFEDHHTPTIIVSPLIALIKDHIRRSEKLVPATSITGEMSGNDRKRIYRGLKEGEIGILHTTSDQVCTIFLVDRTLSSNYTDFILAPDSFRRIRSSN